MRGELRRTCVAAAAAIAVLVIAGGLAVADDADAKTVTVLMSDMDGGTVHLDVGDFLRSQTIAGSGSFGLKARSFSGCPWINLYNPDAMDRGYIAGTASSAGTWSCTLTYEQWRPGATSPQATFTAQFTVAVSEGPHPSTVTLYYNANGGTGAPLPQSQTASPGSGITFAVAASVPVRSGHTFVGWSLSASSAVPAYQPGDLITISADTTLSAVWGLDITSAAQMRTASLTGYSILKQDITLVNWVPLGTESSPFSGTFDGAGHTITLSQSSLPSGTGLIGIFGYVTGTIQNLKVDLAVDIHESVQPALHVGENTVSGHLYAGSIAAHLKGTVTHCAAYGTVSISIEHLFHWPASNSPEIIIRADYDLRIGGLVGHCDGGRVICSYGLADVSGDVTSSQTGHKNIVEVALGAACRAGGLVGHGSTPTGQVYCAGRVSAVAHASAASASHATLTEYAAAGALSAAPSGTSTGFYLEGSVSTTGVIISKGTAKPLADLMRQSTFAGWDISQTWFMEEGETTPILSVFAARMTFAALPEYHLDYGDSLEYAPSTGVAGTAISISDDGGLGLTIRDGGIVYCNAIKADPGEYSFRVVARAPGYLPASQTVMVYIKIRINNVDPHIAHVGTEWTYAPVLTPPDAAVNQDFTVKDDAGHAVPGSGITLESGTFRAMFREPATYYLTFTVSKAGLESNSKTLMVVVQPAVSAPPGLDGVCGSLHNSLTGAYLFTAVNPINAVSYYWEFGDGVTLTSSDPYAIHEYRHNGWFDVRLTAFNSAHDSSATATTAVFVAGSGYYEAAYLDMPYSRAFAVGNDDLTVDPGDDWPAGWEMAVAYASAPDGTRWATVSGTPRDPAYVGNTYNISVRWGEHAESWAVTVYKRSAVPEASFSHSVSGLTLTLTFAGTAFSDLAWDFGDGYADLQSKTVSHTYAAAGTYTVSLTVRFYADLTRPASHAERISVGGSDPPPEPPAPGTIGPIPDVTAKVGVPLSIAVRAPAGASLTTDCAWLAPDGLVLSGTPPSPGTYQVTVTAQFADGSPPAITSFIVTVLDVVGDSGGGISLLAIAVAVALAVLVAAAIMRLII